MPTLTRIASLPALLIVLAFGLAGCGSTTEIGHTFYLGTDTLGRQIIGGQCLERGRGQWSTECRSVRVTNDAADEEFWQFEARVKVRAVIGIPYGRMPQDYNVIGSRETCEQVRAQVTDPTEPCKGPFYFKREPSSAAAR